MKTFLYKGNTYARVKPSPYMYRSQMVRAVTNRGDIFAVNIDTMEFTVIPGKGKVEVIEKLVVKKPKMVSATQLKLAL